MNGSNLRAKRGAYNSQHTVRIDTTSTDRTKEQNIVVLPNLTPRGRQAQTNFESREEKRSPKDTGNCLKDKHGSLSPSENNLRNERKSTHQSVQDVISFFSYQPEDFANERKQKMIEIRKKSLGDGNLPSLTSLPGIGNHIEEEDQSKKFEPEPKKTPHENFIERIKQRKREQRLQRNNNRRLVEPKRNQSYALDSSVGRA